MCGLTDHTPHAVDQVHLSGRQLQSRRASWRGRTGQLRGSELKALIYKTSSRQTGGANDSKAKISCLQTNIQTIS